MNGLVQLDFGVLLIYEQAGTCALGRSCVVGILLKDRVAGLQGRQSQPH